MRMTEMAVSGEETVLQNKPGGRIDPEKLDEFLCCWGQSQSGETSEGPWFPLHTRTQCIT